MTDIEKILKRLDNLPVPLEALEDWFKFNPYCLKTREAGVQGTTRYKSLMQVLAVVIELRKAMGLESE